ncbi:mechanosensitive ion channel family protein [Chlamydiia bacterium]|jgi:hypothetical protein|nr:mechanosensitive ion channel family protein [Chlamydiia bacterium]
MSEINVGSDDLFLKHLFISSMYILVLVAVRFFLEKTVRSSFPEWSTDHRLRVIGNIRSSVLGLLIFGLLYLWAQELQDLATSIAFVALAIVIALKELILCVHGYVFLLRSKAYSLGDRIQVGQLRGEVVDIAVLSTKILEIGSENKVETGRTLVFPNSLLLDKFVFNESSFEHFSIINLELPFDRQNDDWQYAKTLLLDLSKKHCSPFLEKARRRAKDIQRRKGLELPSVDPHILISVCSPNLIKLSLRVACPINLKEGIEQKLISEFLDVYDERIKLNDYVSTLRADKENYDMNSNSATPEGKRSKRSLLSNLID